MDERVRNELKGNTLVSFTFAANFGFPQPEGEGDWNTWIELMELRYELHNTIRG